MSNSVFKDEGVSVAYFSTAACNVCKVLRPKIENILESDFPEVSFHFIDSEQSPDIAAKHMVFSAPVIIVFADGKETKRYARNLSLDEFVRDMERLVSFFS